MLIADVLILADVFERFRDLCLDPAYLALDPAHYVSAPQLSWDGMLKHTRIVLELIHDHEMFRTIDEGMRGGVCMISQRFARANNPKMGPEFDPNKPTSYIAYLDANNLYGWAMSQSLPTDDFEWVSEQIRHHIGMDRADYWQNLNGDMDFGFIVECDLHYPERLHEAHNDYPLAPERMDIKVDQLSDKQVEIKRHYDTNRQSRSVKLVPSLLPKEHYCVHYMNLKFYLEKSMRLRKIDQVIPFDQ